MNAANAVRPNHRREGVLHRAVFLTFALLTSAAATAQYRPTPASSVPARDWRAELQMKIAGSFTVVSVGDVIITRPLSVSSDRSLQEVIELLRNADVTIGNFESNIRDERRSTSPVTSFSGSKDIAPALKSMGFDMVGRANNHAFDSGEAGFRETNLLLEDAGIVTAGAGRDLDEAREAHFFETAKGRVGLVAMHNPQVDGRLPTHLFATRRVGQVGGNAGVNPLRLSKTVVVTADQLAMLKDIRDAIFSHRADYRFPVALVDVDEGLQFFGTRFKAGERPGTNNWVMDRDDLAEILAEIRNGKQNANFLATTIHTHQTESDLQRHGDTVPDFLVQLAHDAIDNGADVFIGHGPHTLRGLEIYRGKPIFYGLGELFHQLYDAKWPLTERPGQTNAERSVEKWDRMGSTQQNTTEGLIAVSQFTDGRLSEVRLFPTDAQYQTWIVDTGIPRLAPPDQALRMLQRLQELSAPFGTRIEIKGSVGVIRAQLR